MRSIIRKLYYSFPPKWRFIVRRIVFFPIDLFQKREDLVPPKGMIYTGSGDFIHQGNHFLEHFKDAGLKPEHAVLDIGSGIGRMARAIAFYLNEHGSYEGFDVVEKGVLWCKNNIQKRFPAFNFTYVELQNSLYSESGDDASTFKFPYEDNRFNFAFLTSVFTHMPKSEVLHYLNEINRTLDTGGICFSTFFILNEESESLMQSGDFKFSHDYGDYALMDKNVDAANIAFKEEFLLQAIRERGFTIKEIIYGNWCGTRPSKYNEFQDIIILQKEKAGH